MHVAAAQLTTPTPLITIPVQFSFPIESIVCILDYLAKTPMHISYQINAIIGRWEGIGDQAGAQPVASRRVAPWTPYW